MSFALWNAYKSKHGLNHIKSFNTLFRKHGGIEITGTTETDITDLTTPAGAPDNDIEYTVPSGFKFHLLRFIVESPILSNNSIAIRVYIGGVFKWECLLDQVRNSIVRDLPFANPADESESIVWKVQQSNAAPSRLLTVQFYGIEKAI